MHVTELDIGHSVDRVHISDLSPLRFATEYVAKNKPCIITGAMEDWPALHKWNEAYLCQRAGDLMSTMDVTPNGWGDAVTGRVDAGSAATTRRAQCKYPHSDMQRTHTGQQRGEIGESEEKEESEEIGVGVESGGSEERGESGERRKQEAHCGVSGKGEAQCNDSGDTHLHVDSNGSKEWFIIPYETQSTLSNFFRLLRSSRNRSDPHQRLVPYIQHQNNSLAEEYEYLTEDLGSRLSWADEVFGGNPPEATNLWIGDERSVTSFHKDHYENLYAVIAGTKVFTLLPPSDIYRIHYGLYSAAQYQPEGVEEITSSGQSAQCQPQAVKDQASTCQSAENKPQGLGKNPSAKGQSSPYQPLGVEEQTSPGQSAQCQPQAVKEQACPCQSADKEPQEVVGGERSTGLFDEYQPLGLEKQFSTGQCNLYQPRGVGEQTSMCLSAENEPQEAHPAQEVMWCPVDPYPPDLELARQQFGNFFDPDLPKPLVAEVGPGEVLYLPSIWFHHVEQRTTSPGKDYVVAVNFWYDMKFDAKFAYFKLAEGLAVKLGMAPPMPTAI
eukprot:gene3308-13336_t